MDAQIGFLNHHGVENSVLLHAKYTRQDKNHWFQQVFKSFCREGDHRFDVLRSGPIVQASLNISCDKMLTELTSAENWLQRLGRLDRFGKNVAPNPYTTVIPESIEKHGKQSSQCARFLNQLCIWQSTKAWLEFLRAQIIGKETVTLNQLYQVYRDFYSDAQCQQAIEGDFIKALKKSARLITDKIIDPISVLPKSKKDNSVVKISSTSLRGDNRFVQMAVCRVAEDLSIKFENSYAYDETFDPAQALNSLTASVESMRGFGEDDNNLVQFMRKKHHNIKKTAGYKQMRNEWELIKQARSPETPIYLSYTPEDLNAVGGVQVAHSQAVYYVSCKKQPVGAMTLAKLNKKLKSESVL